MLAIAAVVGMSHCAACAAQDITPPAAVAIDEPATTDGCEIVARIDGQVVLACEVLWQVNRMLEQNRERIPPEQYAEVRDQLMQRQIAQLVDTKLLYREFAREVPPENMPQIEENLLAPFEEHEEPRLLQQFNVNSRRELELELTRLGSSLNDARRSFNEKAIAGEWVRSKIKINEEIRPDELLNYYQQHAADYEYPAQARWEELMVRKGRFADPQQAYATMAELGNAAWQLSTANPNYGGPLFADLAKARSDSFKAAEDGGQRDWTTRGALKAAAIDEAIFALPVGALSPILESESGFHIVRVLERKEAGRTPFTEVQADIREKIKDERYREKVEKYLTKIRRDASIWTVYTGPVSAEMLLGRPPGGAQQR
jgi:hypothetical protein